MDKPEIEQITRTLNTLLSQEFSEIEPNVDEQFYTDYKIMGTILSQSKVLKILHDWFHFVQAQSDCEVACNTLVAKAFLMGYTCRRSMNQENELAKLFKEVKT